ncbi:MAG: thioesterase domain-containing protein, partial [Schlesneria sp.]
HLVVVGAKLRVPLEVLPSDIPVWWLKLDGLHVWPPKHLSLKSQAAIHAQELSDEIPSGNILLCGHSYGATLAIEIALQLTKANNYGIKLVLMEPPLWSTKDETITEKIARKLNELMNRDLSQNFREYSRAFYKSTVGRVKNLMISSRTSSDHDIPVDDRWEYLEAFLRENSRRYQASETLTHDVHLIKTRLYYEGSLERLKQIAKSSLQIHDAPDHLDHFDIAEPQHSMVWMSIVLKLFDHDTIQHSISTPSSSQVADALAQTSAATQI